MAIQVGHGALSYEIILSQSPRMDDVIHMISVNTH